MKIAPDPTPFHHNYELLEFPALVAELGFEYLPLTPHIDFIRFFNHPRAGVLPVDVGTCTDLRTRGHRRPHRPPPRRFRRGRNGSGQDHPARELAEHRHGLRPDTVMVSSVFAEDEAAHDVSRDQLKTMTEYLSKYRKQT